MIQKKNGLTFGTDAYLLYAYMRPQKAALAVDLGAGTGIVSLLALAGGKFAHVYAVEVQESFAELIGRNAALNGLSDRLSVVGRDLRTLAAKDLGREVDAVFTNPPYMTVFSGKANEHSEKYIARHEVCGGISDFCRAASRLLKFKGRFYAVYRPDRLSELMSAMREFSLEPKRMTFVHSDEDHIPSLVLLEAVKGGSVGLYVTKPLLLNRQIEGKLLPTEDIRYIYENGVFHEQFERPRGKK